MVLRLQNQWNWCLQRSETMTRSRKSVSWYLDPSLLGTLGAVKRYWCQNEVNSANCILVQGLEFSALTLGLLSSFDAQSEARAWPGEKCPILPGIGHFWVPTTLMSFETKKGCAGHALNNQKPWNLKNSISIQADPLPNVVGEIVLFVLSFCSMAMSHPAETFNVNAWKTLSTAACHEQIFYPNKSHDRSTLVYGLANQSPSR